MTDHNTTSSESGPNGPLPAEKKLKHSTSSAELSRQKVVTPGQRRLLKWLVPVFVAALLGGIVGIAVAATIHVPAAEAVADLDHALVTELFDTSGDSLQRYRKQTRFMLEEGDVPEVLQQALLAAEDRNFRQHGGIDLMGIVRSAVRNVQLGEIDQGASTLTMQLAGTLFLDRTERSWERKVKEAFYAVELEKTLSKQQILTLYSNVINLGHGNYGFEAASRYYFGIPAAELTADKAATLVAIVPRPSKWTPIQRPELILTRRNRILSAMAELGSITEEELTAAREKDLGVATRSNRPQIGEYFAEDVRRYLYDTYGEKGLYERGLKVQTTLDPQMQRATERALRRGLTEIDRLQGWRGAHAEVDLNEDYDEPSSWSWGPIEDGDWREGVVLKSNATQAEIRVDETTYTIGAVGTKWTRKARVDQALSPGKVVWFSFTQGDDGLEIELTQEPEVEGAVVLLDSATGAIRALSGGFSYARSEFNRATQAKRQAGSAFKPFVFGAAFEAGYTPADTLFDAPVAFPGADQQLSYSPRNFYRTYEGIITLRKALEKSINVTAVKLQDLVGPNRVIDFARRSGIESDLFPFPSLALGAAELTPLEVAAAYAAIANQGLYVEPYMIERVTTPDGRALEQHQLSAGQAMEPDIAYLLSNTMRGVVQRGTATSLKPLGIELAGKTGTTDDYSDAWFAGFSPEYTLVVWVGHDRKKRIGRGMTGARAALPIWKQIFEIGLEEGWVNEDAKFAVPPNIVLRPIEANSGLLPSGSLDEKIIYEAFIQGTEPAQTFDPKMSRVMELPWYQQRAFYGVPKEGERMPEDVVDWTPIRERWGDG